jgi:hypothetical protein
MLWYHVRNLLSLEDHLKSTGVFECHHERSFVLVHNKTHTIHHLQFSWFLWIVTVVAFHFRNHRCPIRCRCHVILGALCSQKGVVTAHSDALSTPHVLVDVEHGDVEGWQSNGFSGIMLHQCELHVSLMSSFHIDLSCIGTNAIVIRFLSHIIFIQSLCDHVESLAI